MYKIETHLHTTHVSQCGKMTAKEIVDAYKKAKYKSMDRIKYQEVLESIKIPDGMTQEEMVEYVATCIAHYK